MSTDYSIELPQGVSAEVENSMMAVKGPAAELRRKFPNKKIDIKVEGSKISLKTRDKSSSTRALAGTYNSHIKNMVAGAQKPFIYKLKVAFSHFPITVNVSGSEFAVQNFLGEKRPRKFKLPAGAKVSVKGDIITVESSDIELAGRIATLIEQTTRIRGRDRRVFQDGIYIVEKGKGK